jgi:hypothetical protein
MTSTPLSELAVKELVYTWFKELTDKAPLETMFGLLSDAELRMIFPEATLNGRAEFEQWYQTVTHAYFDQAHELKLLQVDLDGDEAAVNLIVNWQARVWNPPAARSDWLGFNVRQRWLVRRDAASGRPVIVNYEVVKADPMPGSSDIG